MSEYEYDLMINQVNEDNLQQPKEPHLDLWYNQAIKDAQNGSYNEDIGVDTKGYTFKDVDYD